MITIANANALHIPLPDQSVQCIVTSPPYYGLRDYGTAKWEGGSVECDHVAPQWANDPGDAGLSAKTVINANAAKWNQRNASTCPRCGARRIDAQIGLESTPTAYVANIVAVMRECWRVLKDDGTLWLNLGDSYSTIGGSNANPNRQINTGQRGQVDAGAVPNKNRKGVDGLKPKDLCGIPWRVAFALQDDGWYLRQDIIWAKAVSGTMRSGSAMPESVQDRCCKSHEYVFLLTKQPRYYFDALAIADDIDNTKAHEYNTWYENENVLSMQDGEAAYDVQQEQSASGRIYGNVQSVSVDSPQEVQSQIQSEQEGAGNGEALLLLEERASDQEGVSPEIYSDGRTEGAVSGSSTLARERAEIQGSSKALSGKPQGEKVQGGERQTTRQNGKRKILKAQDRDQAQASNEVNGLHAYQKRMDSDQGEVWEPVRILREGSAVGNGSRNTTEQGRNTHGEQHSSSVSDMQREEEQSSTATRRSVWLVNPQPYSGAHFATFPPALIEPMILAGTSARGECPQCGKAWVRVVKKNASLESGRLSLGYGVSTDAGGNTTNGHNGSTLHHDIESVTVGWRQQCTCQPHEPIPQTVLDPFAGSGTTGAVAVKHGRRAVLLDLNTKYIDLQFERTNGVQMTMPV